MRYHWTHNQINNKSASGKLSMRGSCRFCSSLSLSLSLSHYLVLTLQEFFFLRFIVIAITVFTCADMRARICSRLVEMRQNKSDARKARKPAAKNTNWKRRKNVLWTSVQRRHEAPFFRSSQQREEQRCYKYTVCSISCNCIQWDRAKARTHTESVTDAPITMLRTTKRWIRSHSVAFARSVTQSSYKVVSLFFPFSIY